MAQFTPLDLSAHRAPGQAAETAWRADMLEAMKALPTGRQTWWGIPFELGAAEEGDGRWLVLHQEPREVEVGAPARYLVVAHFCNTSSDSLSTPSLTVRSILQPGEHLADYVLVYADG